MKKYLLLIIASLGLATACSDKEEQIEPKPSEPTEAFSFQEIDVTSRTATFKVTPADVTAPYIALITSRDMVDEFPDDQAFFDQVFAEFEGMQWSLESQLYVGPRQVEAYRLSPNTLYTVAVFGCSREGEPTTELYTHDFLSLKQARDMVDVTFDIQVTNIVPDGAIITVTPSNNDLVYVTFAGDNAIIKQYGGNLLLAAQFMVEYAEADGQIDWGNYDSSESIRKGPATFNYMESFAGGKEQAVISFGINRWGEVISEVGYAEFRTPAPPRSDMTFSFEVKNINFNSADVIITPSKTGETYYADVAVKSFMESMTEQEFFEGMMSQYGLSSEPSVEIKEHGTLEPNTEYVAFGFGCSASCVTTDLIKYEFRTPDFVYKSGGEAWVDQEVLFIEDGAVLQSPGYGIVTMQYIPNDKTVRYYVATPPLGQEQYWADLDEDELKKKILLATWSTDHPDDMTIWADKLGRTANYYTVGEDKDGFYGDINTLKVKIELSGNWGTNTFSSAAKWNRKPEAAHHLNGSRGPVSTFATPKTQTMK